MIRGSVDWEIESPNGAPKLVMKSIKWMEMDIQFDNISEEIKNMGTKFGSKVTECNKKIFNLHAVCFDFSSFSACEATNL